MSIRAFGDVGATFFAASDTFDAVLGSSTGMFFGGGVEVVFPGRYFVNARLSRFKKSGERVFVDDGEVFPLGIPLEVGITPVEVTGGYRFRARGRTRNFIPYIGAGVGWHRYSETSDFAGSDEDVSETFTGFHGLGGIEFRLSRIFAVGGEGQWTTVPDALGTETTSASEAFGEKNLGGFGFRVRFTVGR
jgi:opacity protein-like surface antigen